MAFEKSGVPDEAQKKYQSVLNKLYAIKGTQEEKERFFKKVLCIGSLAVDSLDAVTALISILIAVYRKYAEKHPDVSIEKFTKAFLKDTISTYDDSWMENFLPLCKAITDCKKVNLCGAKNLEECKSKINNVLDKLLP